VNVVERERLVIEQVIPTLESEGYTVYLQPSRQQLPSFMKRYVPDAIALGPRKKLAIEVVFDEPLSKLKLDELRGLFDGQGDWELRVLYSRAARPKDILPAASNAEIARSINSVENLAASGQFGAALLIAWSTLEALGRRLLGTAFQRPQPATQLVEALAGRGDVTPSEADLLRKLAPLRSQLSHGKLDISVEPSELNDFVRILKVLHTLSEAAAAAS
jgi:REase_AHJR-like